MAKFGYTVEVKAETMARAYGRELPIAWKKAVELAREIRGKKVERALEYLDNVIALKQPVRFRRYNRWVAHKSGYGPARYPVKAARYFRKVLESAVSNAEYLGRTEPEGMVIRTINAHKGTTNKGIARRAQGRSTPWNQETVNLEVVLEEVE
ncbi:MAG TPA: 50S ribosomal protein L22 [Thermoplasmata archaeon]|uniref:Large ribosomal subunit protein uL22 n=2 Tax=environmental samples TaxID=68359 RepID=A0A0H4TBT1_9EURY|nr:ribosomal protein L22(archaeal)/L17(eukaryotic/archaeal) [uncultured euryarchaeote Rifle_16ft_4_minimus_34155]AKQ03952.1 ribosomal protein L22(archaeal)/L17(eukaryotic/archaeal) [uncultured euryarchaeote Rifle_16ft_4_minimus_39]